MSEQRRHYSKEFKLEAVHLVEAQGGNASAEKRIEYHKKSYPIKFILMEGKMKKLIFLLVIVLISCSKSTTRDEGHSPRVIYKISDYDYGNYCAVRVTSESLIIIDRQGANSDLAMFYYHIHRVLDVSNPPYNSDSNYVTFQKMNTQGWSSILSINPNEYFNAKWVEDTGGGQGIEHIYYFKVHYVEMESLGLEYYGESKE